MSIPARIRSSITTAEADAGPTVAVILVLCDLSCIPPSALSALRFRSRHAAVAQHDILVMAVRRESRARRRGRRCVRRPWLAVLQRGDAGQLSSLEELERGAAAGRDVGHPVGEPSLLDRRRRVAAADDRGGARRSATSARDRRACRRRTAAISKTPIGPFQTTVCASAQRVPRTPRRVCGPMSRIRHPGGHVVDARPSRLGASAANSLGDDDVDRQRRARRRAPRARAARRASVELVRPRPATLPISSPLRLQEGVRHAAADEQRVDLRQQVLDHADLVGHLGAAEDRDERPRRVRAAPGRGRRAPSPSAGRRPRAGSCATPSVEACARCAVPKASLT